MFFISPVSDTCAARLCCIIIIKRKSPGGIYRSVVAECIQEQCVGHSAHAARDVQLQAPSHSASLPHPAPQSASSAGAGPADDTVPAAALV